MSCFPCFSSQRSNKSSSNREQMSSSCPEPPVGVVSVAYENKNPKPVSDTNDKEQTSQVQNGNIAAKAFNFRELATATKNLRQECLLGDSGFGKVYKGTLKETGQVVAVKQLDRNVLQGSKDFFGEVSILCALNHPYLVSLVGYCADGDQRLLVYEYMSGGSLRDNVLDIKPEQKPLNWSTRMKIAFGAAEGLEYLHDKANPPIVYGDFRSSNILLDEDHNPKLSGFALGKFGMGDKMQVSSRGVGTYGYCAPEYAKTNQLTTKSDVFSFGVILLELLTGRRAIDTTKPIEEQNLVAWAQPLFRDPQRFPDMADPLLNKEFPEKCLNQAVAVAAMCLQDEPSARPIMSDVVATLGFLSMDSQTSKPENNPTDGDSDSSDGESV